MRQPFAIGQAIRYKPGSGTYGYELETNRAPDGRVPGVVVGYSKTRVRVTLALCFGSKTRCVNIESVKKAAV